MKKIKFLRINFGTYNEKNIKKIIKKSGLFVFPSAPVLTDLQNNQNLHISLINSDHVFFDSGFFVLLLNLFKNYRIEKFSGYRFLKFYFSYLKSTKKKVLLIDPNIKLSKSYKKYMLINKIKSRHYVAPNYKKENIIDKKLLNLIKKIKVKEIIINIGGGTQEILGYYLRRNLKSDTKIVCTGAAIAFFTRDQAPINNLIDKLYLGWFLRILFKPNIFFPRYLNSIKFIKIFFSNKTTSVIK